MISILNSVTNTHEWYKLSANNKGSQSKEQRRSNEGGTKEEWRSNIRVIEIERIRADTISSFAQFFPATRPPNEWSVDQRYYTSAEITHQFVSFASRRISCLESRDSSRSERDKFGESKSAHVFLPRCSTLRAIPVNESQKLIKSKVVSNIGSKYTSRMSLLRTGDAYT